MVKRSYSSLVDNVEFREYITGEFSRSKTGRWSILGTDLGIPFYSKKDQCMYILFGDTFATPFPSQEKWRGNVMGIQHNTDVTNGFYMDDFIKDDLGDARFLFKAHHDKEEGFRERTKIAQGGIEVDGALYIFIESIRRWGERGWWDVNYTGVIKSTDSGETWERVYDLSWVETDKGEKVDVIKALVEEDINMEPSGLDINLSERVAPFFGQMYPLDGKDGYIYVYGRRAGRQFGIKVGRVKKANFEKFSEYEYFVGFDKDDNAKWVKGTKGLKAIAENDEESYIVSHATSNMSVFYNIYLGKWVLLYYKPGTGICMKLASTPYGKFGKDHVILDENKFPLAAGKGHLYGAFSHEFYLGDNGKEINFIVSQWNDVTYNSMLYKATLK